MEKMLDSMVRYASFAVMSALQNAWRDTLQYVKEYHDALNEIRIVTNGTEADASNMGRTFVEMAKRLSVNSSEIAGAAVEFYRQGLSDSEVNSRLEWTIKYAKIAGLEFQEAAEIITAATNSMEIDVQRVADVFTYLGDASASGADEIGIAMQRASASAMEAGVSFEWLGAYIATVSEKTRQAPEVIGTAFNSIMARLHSIKSTGFNEEDATRINDVAKALATLPKPLSLINELTGEWVDMSTLFEQIAEQWDDLSDKQRAYIATTMAGTRQQNVFLTLMNDMAKAGENASRAYELYAGAVNASGTVTQKYSVYQESVTASLDSLTAAWQGFVNLIADGSVFSSFYGFLEKLVDLLAAGTEATHGINLGILAVAAACAVLVPAISKLVVAINQVITALKAGEAVLSTTKIGMIISVVLSLIGVIATLVAGMQAVNEEAKKIDYSKAKTGIEGNIKTLENLIGRYEELAGKTSLTVAEEEEMRDIMNEIALLSPKYAQALSDAQGNVTASIEIANQALQDQLDLLTQIEAAAARETLRDKETISQWQAQVDPAVAYVELYRSLFEENGLFYGVDFSSSSATSDLVTKLGKMKSGEQKAALKQVKALAESMGLLWDGNSVRYFENNFFRLAPFLNANTHVQTYTSSMKSIELVANEMVRLLETSMAQDPDWLALTVAEQNYVRSSLAEEYKRRITSGTPIDELAQLGYQLWSGEVVYADKIGDIDANAMPEYIKSALSNPSRWKFDEDGESFKLAMVLSGVNSDQLKNALDEMKAFYGEAFDDQIVNERGQVNADNIIGWIKDPVSSIIGEMNHKVMKWGRVTDQFTPIYSALLGEGETPETIVKSFSILWAALDSGKVTVDNFYTAMSGAKTSKEIADAYRGFMGQVNGVVAASSEADARISEIHKQWDDYITDIGHGRTADAYKAFTEQVEDIAHAEQLYAAA